MRRNAVIAILAAVLLLLLWQAWKAGQYVMERAESPFKYFSYSEFDSPDEPGSGKIHMKESFIRKLDRIREAVGLPMFITSGYRSPSHNISVNGVTDSAHTTGYAADIAAPTDAMKRAIAREAIRQGITRIGWGSTFIHLDADPFKTQYITWGYGGNTYPTYGELALQSA